MKFTSYITECYQEPEKKQVKESAPSPRNFKSYIKRINSQPVVVMCCENKSLIEECKRLSIKYHVIKEKYLVEDKGEKVTIRDMYGNGYYISVNKKNTLVLDSEEQIVEKLNTVGLRVLSEKQIKEKLNG